MNILVVGGAGYVGCVLTRFLLEQGHSVRVLDRLFFGDTGLDEIREEIELVSGDLRDISAGDLGGIDGVINLGGISSDPQAEFKPDLTLQMNVVGAVNLAKASKDAGVKRYLFASSCSVYDSDVVDAESGLLLNEESSVAPTSAYARSKLEAEKQLLALGDEDFCVVALRKGTIYGFSPRMRYDLVINTLLKDALSRSCMTLQAGGEMWRPVVEIRDVVRAYAVCLVVSKPLVNGQIFNVVYGNFRVCEMALRIRERLRTLDFPTDIIAEYEHRKVRSYRVSGSKLETILGVKPEINIEHSIECMVGEIQSLGNNDFGDPKFYNIEWLKSLEE